MNEQAENYFKLVKEAEQKLYPNCKKVYKIFIHYQLKYYFIVVGDIAWGWDATRYILRDKWMIDAYDLVSIR